jgi:hypothetical protein
MDSFSWEEVEEKVGVVSVTKLSDITFLAMLPVAWLARRRSSLDP